MNLTVLTMFFSRYGVALVSLPGDGGAGGDGACVPPPTTVALHRGRGRCRASVPGRVMREVAVCAVMRQ